MRGRGTRAGATSCTRLTRVATAMTLWLAASAVCAVQPVPTDGRASPLPGDAGPAARSQPVPTSSSTSAHSPARRSDSYVEQERDIAREQPGPHEGEGTTTAYPFFADAAGFDLVFRKRALHPGATIGDHVNDKDEIYYLLSGRGELTLGDATREVGAGDAILTRDGDRHALRQLGTEDLVIFIVYNRPSPKR